MIANIEQIIYFLILANYKIAELLCTLSLVKRSVTMRVCKHGCDVLDWRVLLRIIFIVKQKPNLNTLGVGGILESYANLRYI